MYVDQGFNPNIKNMASDYKYALEVYQVPQMFNESSAKPNWKEMA